MEMHETQNLGKTVERKERKLSLRLKASDIEINSKFPTEHRIQSFTDVILEQTLKEVLKTKHNTRCQLYRRLKALTN